MGLTSLFLRRRPITYPAGMIVEDVIQVRISGGPELPTLIYVPGLHGDWTLVGSFRKAVKGRVRFVEMTYPRKSVGQKFLREVEVATPDHILVDVPANALGRLDGLGVPR